RSTTRRRPRSVRAASQDPRPRRRAPVSMTCCSPQLPSLGLLYPITTIRKVRFSNNPPPCGLLRATFWHVGTYVQWILGRSCPRQPGRNLDIGPHPARHPCPATDAERSGAPPTSSYQAAFSGSGRVGDL